MVPHRYLILTLPISPDDSFRLSVFCCQSGRYEVGLRYLWGRYSEQTYLIASPFYKGFSSDWGTSTPKSRFFSTKQSSEEPENKNSCFYFVLCPLLRIFAPNQPQEPRWRWRLGLLRVNNNSISYYFAYSQKRRKLFGNKRTHRNNIWIGVWTGHLRLH